MRSFSSILGVLVLATTSTAACSSSADPTNQTQDGGGASSNPEDAGAAADAGSSKTLKAPTITMVMKMTGGLHLMWTNNQTDCDAIEGERKSATEAYKVVFTVPDGSVDNKHDAPLTAGTEYTYRLRCKKGTDYSPPSNEKSGSP